MLLSTAAQMRRADQIMIDECKYPGLLLMETAGRKAAEYILARYPNHNSFLILAGPGNNGGDGIVVARYLFQAGKEIKLMFSASPEKFTGDAAINFQLINASENIHWHVWPVKPPILEGTVLIDALLGTGTTEAARGAIAEMIKEFEHYHDPVVAIDIPSGINVDTGFLPPPIYLDDYVEDEAPAIQADCTVTFQLPKIAHAVYPAATYSGEVVVADLGMWRQVFYPLAIYRNWVDGDVVRQLSFITDPESHKGTYGHALLIGGSDQYPGAIALSGHAALQAGAGLSTVVAPETCRNALFGLGPEVIFHRLMNERITQADKLNVLRLSREKAVGLGPGWTTHSEISSFFHAFLTACASPLVLDADALNLLAESQRWDLVPKMSILTPHPGEMKRLLELDAIPTDRLEAAEKLARKHGVVVVLKGAGTIIASPAATWVNSTGNPGMGTGGSGDVLTGMITGLLAQGYEPTSAAVIATYIHGLAGDLAEKQFGKAAVTASRILACIGPAWKMLENKEEPQIKTI